MNAVVYLLATGEVLRSIAAPANHIAKQCNPGESYVCKFGLADTHYVDISTPGHPLREKDDDYTLEALPLPCVLTIEDIEYSIAEQPDGFGFDAPGRYEIECDPGVKYVKKTFYVDHN